MAKQIQYIDYYVDGKRQGNLGFFREFLGCVEVVLRNVPIQGRTERNVYFIKELYKDKIQIGKIIFLNGMGQVKLNISESLRGGKLYIPISNNSYAACEEWRGVKDTLDEAEIRNGNIQVIKRDIDGVESRESDNRIEPVFEANKWKQICKTYPNVHVFPQAETVLIKPNDLIVLHSNYHELATNSFLLHAYYNYRQLLLCRNKEDKKYYLGVPGVYYEREMQLAALYGYTDFENGESKLENGNQRKVYLGCFGYYMRQVEI